MIEILWVRRSRCSTQYPFGRSSLSVPSSPGKWRQTCNTCSLCIFRHSICASWNYGNQLFLMRRNLKQGIEAGQCISRPTFPHIFCLFFLVKTLWPCLRILSPDSISSPWSPHYRWISQATFLLWRDCISGDITSKSCPELWLQRWTCLNRSVSLVGWDIFRRTALQVLPWRVLACLSLGGRLS